MLRVVPSENWYKSTGQPFTTRTDELIYYLVDAKPRDDDNEKFEHWRFKLGLSDDHYNDLRASAEWYIGVIEQLDGEHPRVFEALLAIQTVMSELQAWRLYEYGRF